MADSMRGAYEQYVLQYDKGMKTLAYCEKKEPEFVEFMERYRDDGPVSFRCWTNSFLNNFSFSFSFFNVGSRVTEELRKEHG